MMNGTNQLAVINQHIATARNGLDAVYRRMEAANQQISQLRNRLAEEYRELARFRLDELAANRVTTQLDETDRAVLKLLERRSQALRELDGAIEQSTARQEQLTAEREQAVLRRDDLVKQIDESAAEVKFSSAARTPTRCRKNASKKPLFGPRGPRRKPPGPRPTRRKKANPTARTRCSCTYGNAAS